jgi:ATP-dependent protease HslVU (ClpYQ) peptidase subunit
MTTVVVTKKNGQACIAADTLATYGDMRETAELIANSDKLVRIGDAWVAPTGPASAQLVLRHFIASYDELPVLEDIDGIFDFLTHFQRALREEYFVQGKEDSHDDFESMRMELLIASPGGLFGAYPQRSVQEFKKFYAFGSGAEYAMGAMAAAWDHVDSAEELARIGVETAARFDVNSGLPLTLRRVALREGQQEPPLFAPRVVRDGALETNGTPDPGEPAQRANGEVRAEDGASHGGRSAHEG